ncbi:MAG TPA: prolyl oligopeptidase family serine peptidase, partial [Nitrospiria bacterium]|nr:prolyl oligopeptidase family serine peptidase [Nitrospiria bacterium]
MRSRVIRLIGVLLAGSTTLLASCSTHRQWGPASPDTLAAVRAFLSANDTDAEQLIPALAARPIDHIENALHQAIANPILREAPVGKQPGRRFQVGNRTFHYALYVPDSYRAERAYPLVICLHGAGFGGETYIERWEPRLKDGFLLACPTIKDAAWWTRDAEALVMAVLAEVSRTYWVDPDRVFLTGMSNGGTGVFVIGLNHADRFAALVPMASALPRGLYPLLENGRQSRFYIIHGARDEVMPVKYSRDLVSYLQRNGFQIVYREHEKEHPLAGGHFFPQEELPDLVEWLSV